jgi:hypothetical protein
MSKSFDCLTACRFFTARLPANEALSIIFVDAETLN